MCNRLKMIERNFLARHQLRLVSCGNLIHHKTMEGRGLIWMLIFAAIVLSNVSGSEFGEDKTGEFIHEGIRGILDKAKDFAHGAFGGGGNGQIGEGKNVDLGFEIYKPIDLIERYNKNCQKSNIC